MTDAPTDLRPNLARHLAFEEAKERANVVHFQKEAQRVRGVCVSMPPLDRPAPRSPRDLIAAATASADREAAWKVSPRGRLYAAIRALAAAGYEFTASRMYNSYTRGISTSNPPSTNELTYCLQELAGVPLNDGAARAVVADALAALGELLQVQAGEAA